MSDLKSRVAEELGLEPGQAEELLRTLLRVSREDLEGLRLAAARADAQSVAHLAHHIKGAAANLEVEDLRAAAERLEALGKQGELASVAVELEALQRALWSLEVALA